MIDESTGEINSAVQAILDARPRFSVGARVRVRLNGECRLRGAEDSAQAWHGRVGHWPREDGLTGTVSWIWEDDDFLSAQGHPYEIRWDVDQELEPGEFYALACYAPTELEHLAP